MDKTYHINGTEFYNPPIEYLSKETYPNFQLKLEEFKLLLKKQVENGEGKSYFKFGDGDYFFLKENLGEVLNQAIGPLVKVIGE